MARFLLWAGISFVVMQGCTNDYGKFRFPRHGLSDSGADGAVADGGVPDARADR